MSLLGLNKEEIRRLRETQIEFNELQIKKMILLKEFFKNSRTESYFERKSVNALTYCENLDKK